MITHHTTFFRQSDGIAYKSRHLFKLVLFVMSFLGMGDLPAQGLFTELNVDEYNFTETERSIWTVSSGKTQFSSTKLISIGNLANALNANGELVLDMPNDDCGSITFKPQTVEYVSEQQYLWYGTFEGGEFCECQVGYAMLIADNGKKIGEIDTGSRLYDIQGLSENISILAEVNDTIIAQGKCGVTNEETEIPNIDVNAWVSTGKEIMERGNAPCNIVRVGVMYTPSVDVNPSEIAVKGVALLNAAVASAGVPTTSLRFTNAGVGLLPNVQEGTIAAMDMTAFGTSAAATLFREANEVDILVVLTNGNYTTSTGASLTGLTPAGNVGGPMPALSFCIVDADDAIPSKTFAHEVGHAMGGDHGCLGGNLIPCTGAGPINHGFAFSIPIGDPCSGLKTERTTVMALSDNPKKRRLPIFSNLIGTYGLSSLGNADADMGTWLTGVACGVSETFPNPMTPTELTIGITAPPYASASAGSFAVSASIQGGTAPYSIAWASSNNGVNYNSVVGGFNTNIPFSCTGVSGCIVYVRLTVTDATNTTKTTFVRVPITPNRPAHPGNVIDRSEYEDGMVFFYPNPASDYLEIRRGAAHTSMVTSITITNALGQVQTQETLQIGETINRLPLQLLNAGLYFLGINNGNSTSIHPLMIVRP